MVDKKDVVKEHLMNAVKSENVYGCFNIQSWDDLPDDQHWVLGVPVDNMTAINANELKQKQNLAQSNLTKEHSKLQKSNSDLTSRVSNVQSQRDKLHIEFVK
jgi:TRAP-type mannitol/chloroaromatic compound transport system substrate-binding protein